SRKLLDRPHATFADQLQHLTVLQTAERGELPEFLARVQRTAGTNAPLISQAMIWMLGHEHSQAARDWLTNLPPAQGGTMAIPMVEADCLVALRDWPALENFLQDQRWKELEFLRYAYRSLGAEKRGGGVAVEGHWRTAMHEAGDRLGALTALLTLAAR